MLTSMMCVQMQMGGVLPFEIIVGKDGFSYGFWYDRPSISNIKPDNIESVFKELYIRAGGGMFYMNLMVTGVFSLPIGVMVKIKDKNGNYLPVVNFMECMFERDLDTGNWKASTNCDYKIYQRFESLEPVLGDFILYIKG